MDKDQVDLLKKVEELTNKLNEMFNQKGKSVFSRYPITFALVVVFGVAMVSEGIKGLLGEVPFFKESPVIMLVAGILVLIMTGRLYKKLNK